MIPQVNIPFSVNQLIILTNLPCSELVTALTAVLSCTTQPHQRHGQQEAKVNQRTNLLGKFWMKNKNMVRLNVVLTQSEPASVSKQDLRLSLLLLLLQLQLLQLQLANIDAAVDAVGNIL